MKTMLHTTRRAALCAAAGLALASFGCRSSNAQNSEAVSAKTSGDKTFRFYTVGNSVTDTLNYNAFPKLLEARGYKPVFGRQNTNSRASRPLSRRRKSANIFE